MRHLMQQIGRFIIVGVIATAIDFGVLYLLHHGYGMNYLWAIAIAFIVATVFNYWASMSFIFKSKFGQDHKKQEFSLFVLLSVIGLGLTEILMWWGVEKMQLTVLIAKLLVTGVVMVFNFVSRKLLLEESQSLTVTKEPSSMTNSHRITEKER